MGSSVAIFITPLAMVEQSSLSSKVILFS